MRGVIVTLRRITALAPREAERNAPQQAVCRVLLTFPTTKTEFSKEGSAVGKFLLSLTFHTFANDPEFDARMLEHSIRNLLGKQSIYACCQPKNVLFFALSLSFRSHPLRPP